MTPADAPFWLGLTLGFIAAIPVALAFCRLAWGLGWSAAIDALHHIDPQDLADLRELAEITHPPHRNAP